LTEITHGQLFTLGALHCQKQTTTLIAKYKNDYIIPLKRNPKKLFKAAVKISEIQLSLSKSQTVDINHGSQIVKKVSVFDIEPLKSADFDGSQWGQIRSLVKVETSGTVGKKRLRASCLWHHTKSGYNKQLLSSQNKDVKP
jgi:hypothetical protein